MSYRGDSIPQDVGGFTGRVNPILAVLLQDRAPTSSLDPTVIGESILAMHLRGVYVVGRYGTRG